MAASLKQKLTIYLDIDGVLLGAASPITDRIKFLNYLLIHFPGSTFWLTSYCRSAELDAQLIFGGIYPEELIDRLGQNFQSAKWTIRKTEAIDFMHPFLWFDDNLFPPDRLKLIEHNALEFHAKIDPQNPQAIAQALGFLQKIKSIN